MDSSFFSAPELTLVRDFALALFIGALIGIDRQRHADSDGAQGHFGGMRTFTLCALFGALGGWLGRVTGSWSVLVGGLVALTALLAVTVYVEGRRDEQAPGLTTEVAALVVYLLGAAVLLGHPAPAVMLAIATLAVLTLKESLHGTVRQLNQDDILAGLKLLVASFIVLPLLPDRTVDPWGALNPYKLWLLVILISTLSLVGYIAVRWLGSRRGIALTGVFGGLVSSTAVTLTFARRSRDQKGIDDLLAVGLLLAWTIMLARVVIEVAVVHAPLLATLWPPLAAMLMVSALLVAWLYRHARRGEVVGGDEAPGQGLAPVPLKNPFNLTSAVQFGLLFAAVLLVVRLAQLHVPGEWLYAIAALAGATDVDAITLSLAGLARDGVPHAQAALAILLASWANTVVKCGMVLVLGSRALGRRVLLATLLTILAGAAGFLLG